MLDILTVNFFDRTNKCNIDDKDKFARQIEKDPKVHESHANAYSNVTHLYLAAYLQKSLNNTDVINIYV